MSRSLEYDKDIAEMYGTADPSILFEFSEDKRIARAMGFGYAYYPQNDPLTGLINTLFGNGEVGAMFIPQPVVLGSQALYQEYNGVTPAEADGDPAGMVLDLSRKLELGPELVTNGAFDSDVSGWSTGVGAKIAWADGEALVTGGTNFGVYQPQDLEVGKVYEVVGYGRCGTSADVRVRVVEGDDLAKTISVSNTVTATASNQKMKLVFKAVTTSDSIYLRVSGKDLTGYFDNISVRELPGNNAIQPVSVDRPLYRTDGTLHWLRTDGLNQHLSILDNAPKTEPYASIGNHVSGFWAVRPYTFTAANTTNNWVVSDVIHEIRNLGSGDSHVPFSFGFNGGKLAIGASHAYTGGAWKRVYDSLLETNRAYIIGFVIDGTSVTLYLDGAAVAVFSDMPDQERSPSLGTGNVTSRIGIRTTDTNGTRDGFNGEIFGGLTVGRVMTASEVKASTDYLASLAGVTL